jgi:hypothetical protein
VSASLQLQDYGPETFWHKRHKEVASIVWEYTMATHPILMIRASIKVLGRFSWRILIEAI